MKEDGSNNKLQQRIDEAYARFNSPRAHAGRFNKSDRKRRLNQGYRELERKA